MDSKESTRLGYRIRVRYKHLSLEEADLKKRAIVGVLSEVMQRQTALPATSGEGV